MLNPLKIISKFIKSSNQKTLDKLSLMVNKINLLENEISNLDDVDFPAKTNFLINPYRMKVIANLKFRSLKVRGFSICLRK